MVDESGYPLVSIREAATIVADMRGALTKTTVQRALLGENSNKLKAQQREIDQMERMQQQLYLGRAITNLVFCFNHFSVFLYINFVLGFVSFTDFQSAKKGNGTKWCQNT